MHTFHIRRALQSLGLFTCFALATFLLAIPAATSTASAQVVLSVTVAPPVLPVYTQPVCPGDGYIWTPGYWATATRADISGFPARGSRRPK